MWASIIIGRLILGQGITPLDFNGLIQYGALGFFIMYLLYREWKNDDRYEKLEERFNKHLLEDRERTNSLIENATKVMTRIENKLDK